MEVEFRPTFGLGELNVAYKEYFSGRSFIRSLTDPERTGERVINVTFEPGCRNNWHIHHATSGGGQVLICVDGEGWYQEVNPETGEKKPAVSLRPGSVVSIPANVKHWHGAKKDSWFSHVAIEVAGEGASNEWCEAVSDEEYEELEREL